MDEGLALVIVAIITVSGNAFVTILITILTLLSNVHITKIANADKVHEFKRHLTRYEINAKSADWVIETVEDEEAISRYDVSTKNGILRRYKKIKGKDYVDTDLHSLEILALASRGPADSSRIRGTPPKDIKINLKDKKDNNDDGNDGSLDF